MDKSDDPIKERQRLFYSSTKWRYVRQIILNEHPVCYYCKRNVSEHVHHCLPLSTNKGWLNRLSAYVNGELNLVGTCVPCHNRVEHEAANRQAQHLRHEDLEDFK